jgi:GntR family transcriptional repressor for pyruvate dehydrogenase complex
MFKRTDTLISYETPQPTSFARMHIPKGSELLAQQIRGAILRGELLEGKMLPSEKELMGQLGLSRATVREGLRLLEAEGFITTRPGRGGGAVVRHPTPGRHTRSLATLLQFADFSYEELFESWGALVSVCGRLASRHIKPEQRVELHEQLGKMRASIENRPLFIAHEVRFHMLVTHATNNALLRIYGTSLAEVTYHQIQHVPFSRADLEAGVEACGAILASIEEGDAGRTEHRIACHLESVGAAIARLSQPLDERPVELSGMLARLGDVTAEPNH